MVLLFPNENKYNAEFLKVNQETGVPISVLKGFVALESAFDEKAYRYESRLNDASYGLAQILSRTARGVGFTGDPKELFDPYKSLLYGAKFIRELSKKYPNVLDLIAAYNAGFNRKIAQTTQVIADIYKYPISYREKPPADWVYANEPYVRRVASYIAYYQARERVNNAEAERLLDLIKKKVLTEPTAWLKNHIGELSWEPQTSSVCPSCGRPLPL